MNSCDHCGKEAKFLFVCPKCEKKVCQEHRGISQHNCLTLKASIKKSFNENNSKLIPEENKPKLVRVESDKEIVQEDEPIEQTKDNIIEINSGEPVQKESGPDILRYASPLILLLVVLTCGILILNGNLKLDLDNSEYVLLEEYVILESDYIQLQTELEELKKFNDEREMQNNLIQNLLDQKNEDFLLLEEERNNLSINYEDLSREKEELENKYNFSLKEYASIYLDSVYWNEYITNDLNIKQIPSTSEIKTWLQYDMTDEIFEYSKNSLNGMAIILSLSAQSRNWQVGVLSIEGNFTKDINSLNFCFVQSVEGLLYIDPYLDRVFWYDDYEEIIPDRFYNLGLYPNVYVDNTVIIIPG